MKILEVNVDDIGMGGVYSLVRNVIKNRPADAKVDMLAISESFENPANEAELASYDCKVFFAGFSGNKIIKQAIVFRNIYRIVKAGGYSAAHIHSDVSNYLLIPALAIRAAGCKKILLHSHSSGIDGSNGNRRGLKMIIHKVCRRLLKYIGTDFLACSDLAARWMFPNVDNSSVVIVKNGIDLEKFRFSETTRMKVRVELGIEDKFVIGHVGRFSYVKNHEFIIDVFKMVAEHEPKAVLLLVGEGELEQAIRQKVASLGLTDRVIFYGVSHAANELFQAMDVCVLPSHFEGFPIVGIEAQASGLPCVFSDHITRQANVSGNVDFLPITPDAENSWADKILSPRTIDRASVSDTMRKAGFSINDTVADLWKLYTR